MEKIASVAFQDAYNMRRKGSRSEQTDRPFLQEVAERAENNPRRKPSADSVLSDLRVLLCHAYVMRYFNYERGSDKDRGVSRRTGGRSRRKVDGHGEKAGLTRRREGAKKTTVLQKTSRLRVSPPRSEIKTPDTLARPSACSFARLSFWTPNGHAMDAKQG